MKKLFGKCFRNLRKVFIVMYWKNLTLKLRHYIQTLLEILVPTLLFAATLAIFLEGGSEYTPRPMPEQINATEISLLQYCMSRSEYNLTTIYYTSCVEKDDCRHNSTSQLVEDMFDKLNKSVESLKFVCDSALQLFNTTFNFTLEFMPIASEKILVDVYKAYEFEEKDSELYGGIIFDEDFDYIAGTNEIPPLNYTIRFGSEQTSTETKFLFPFFQLSGPGNSGQQYVEFVKFQNLIDLAYIQIVTEEKLLPESPEELFNIDWMTSNQQMAYPEHISNNVAIFVGIMLPLFTVLSFCFVVPPILKRIVNEKETGVKELMKLMGLPNWMHWLCWFMDGTISAAISVFIAVLLVCVEWESGLGRVIYYSNGFVIYLFFLLYAMSLIIFLFAFSTIFRSPNLALSIGVIIHLITYIVPASTIDDTVFTNLDSSAKFALALLPNVNLWWGIKVLSIQEGRASGVQWSNLFKRSEPSDPLTMGAIWGMFLADMIVYGIITWYIDSINPGKYGVARKWYFLFQKSYWKESFGCNRENTDSGMETPQQQREEGFFEPEPEDLSAGIAVRNLRKVFKSLTGQKVVAVDNVSFSAYDSQITALLGHNGAGKTTTMSVLTGLYSPSGGEAEINGHSISNNMAKARESLGLCPQHNMLFSDLTVYEHLMIFAMIKGLSWSESNRQANRYMVDLGIEGKAKTSSSKLSGGMKRKVHLGVALIGSSKVVLLDEPTSGMDPEARRVIWDLLQMEKKNRTILLTTHFMEEADVLGDRVAIMARGTVQCYGSPLFLKRKFGDGYTLTMTRGPNCDTKATTDLITSNVKGSSLKSTANSELVFNLPMSEAKCFPALFEDLDQNKSTLDFLNLGLSVTTMEDVFLRVGTYTDFKTNSESSSDFGDYHDADTIELQDMKNGGDVDQVQDHEQGPDFEQEERLTGLKLWFLQMKGLLIKRMTYTKRRFFLFTVMAFLPLLMAVVCQVMINFKATPTQDFQARTMLLSDYEDSVTYYNSAVEGMNTSFVNVVDGMTDLIPNSNVTGAILEYGKNHIAEYRNQLIIAAEFIPSFLAMNITNPEMELNITFNEARAIYNSVPVHARPIAQNVISNSLLKHLDNETDSTKSITITNHPLPNSNPRFFQDLSSGFISPVVMFYGIALGAGITIFVSVFLLFPLTERITSAKQVQLMTGVHPLTFWFSNILWDGLLFIISAIAFILALTALDDRKSFTSNGAQGALVLVIALYSLGGIIMSYVFSFFAKSPPAGFALLIILNILVGSIAPVAVLILASVGTDSPSLMVASNVVRYIFTFLPSFPMVRSIMAIAQVQEENNQCTLYFEKDTLNTICSSLSAFSGLPADAIPEAIKALVKCCKPDIVDQEFILCDKPPLNIPCLVPESIYTWDKVRGINQDIVWLMVDLLIFGSLLILIESGILKRVIGLILRKTSGKRSPENEATTETLDSDVAEEVNKVHQLITNGDGLAVDRLIKDFDSLRAVNNLSFGVKNKECFGLLGINGAGKTTTFRMLTGDEILSNGNAFLLGESLVSDRKKFLSMIGYCPQFDSIIEVLTGREMLLLFARLRGIKDDQAEADKWLKALDIVKYADRQCGTYSGGNKRKLNVAMSLVGNPPILFMDEPTTGVDPAGRRKLWNVIKKIKKNGQSIVLTSHSMEECEALCDRLGIMVNGQFRCLGTTRHIKDKFGQGFTILVKLNTRGLPSEQSEAILIQLKTFLSNKFQGGCDVKDEHKDFIHFHVRNPKTAWSHLFLTMEAAKGLFAEDVISDYSVSETTLEQVFISFAKYQRPSSSSDD